MITHAYIHEYGMGKMEPEHKGVQAELLERGIPVSLFTRKRLDRRQLKLLPSTLVVGNHPTIKKALKYLGKTNLPESCYPSSIEAFLKRNILSSTIAAIEASLLSGNLALPLFIKPQGVDKKFTGFVLHDFDDLRHFTGASRQTAVFVSEVVRWQSEHRVFVTQGSIQGIRHYDGNSDLQPDLQEVQACIQQLEASGQATAAYGIDFGVLASGETALIEWNDGYALGAYGLERKLYCDLLIARWLELMK